MASKSATGAIRGLDGQERGLPVIPTVFFLFAPVATMILAVTITYSVIFGYSRYATGGPPAVLPYKQIYLTGSLVHSAASWIDISLLWFWARRRGLSAEIFAFRRPLCADYLAAFGGLALVRFLYQIEWSTGLFRSSLQVTGIDVHDPIDLSWLVIVGIIGWTITAPICEEILFRGLAVKALQSRGFGLGTTWLIATLAFAAIHLPPNGVFNALFNVGAGGVFTAIRLWRKSLTPGFLLHVGNNIVAGLLIPLNINLQISLTY